MGQRYRQNFDENGNVLAPAMWVQDNNEFAGEFNGYLDRDNLPAATIASTDPDASLGGPFNAIRAFNTDDNFAPDMTSTDWQGGTGTGAAGVGYLTWTSLQDAHFDVHWSGTWSWNGAYSRSSNTVAAPNHLDSETEYDTIQLRLVMDGIVIAIAGPFEDGASRWGTYLCGAVQLPAGTHTLRVECAVYRRVWQNSGQQNGVCTNAVTIRERAITVLERMR